MFSPHTTFKDQLMSLLVSSTRPVQAIMGFCGLIAAAGMWTAQYLHTWTPMDEFVAMTSYWFVASCFITYALMSFTSAIYHFTTPPWVKFKYTATLMGVFLWVVCLASSLSWKDGSLVLRDGMSFLYIIPTSADVWVLIQMIAGVEKIERRRWK